MLAFRFATILLLTICIIMPSTAQTSQITLEDIWTNGTYNVRSVPGFRFMNDGEHYTRKNGNAIVKYSIVDGNAVDTLFKAASLTADGFDSTFNSYSFSQDESLVLIKSQSERIYRRSSKAYFFVYDRAKDALTPVFGTGKIMHCTFSPDGRMLAFVYENNLYTHDLGSGISVQVTKDGEYNKVINGSADWVYEEEFGFTKAFEWSPDSKRIAFYRFDESQVKEFPMEYFNGGMYPELVTFKYPKVGEDNSIVTIHIHDLTTGVVKDVRRGSDPDGYIPRIKWTSDPNFLCIFRMNRHQNELEFIIANASMGTVETMMTEVNPYYIEINDDLTFLDGDEGFILTSERDGFNHVYHYGMNGKLVNQITTGEYDVTAFYGYDPEEEVIYYQAARLSPMQREVYRTRIDGKKDQRLTEAIGVSSAQFSSTFDYYIRNTSTANRAAQYTVVKTSNNKELRVIEDNSGITEVQEKVRVSPIEFFSFENRDGDELNGWMLKPNTFDETQQYPVFMYLYGGPGSQQVLDSWRGANYWWFQMLAQQGYVVACIDNRGTGARGQEFRKMTYQELGHYETMDQIDGAKYLASLPFTDGGRIGIFGWSYGGYMSSLCLLKGNEIFKSAIAVAPVTNWKWYDSIYTERYMRTYAENTAGYDDNSPINFADQLKGDYLLVHGIADDNVHWQHTVEMANALIDANKQFDTYFYPNRNHGIGGGNARLHLYTKMTNFIHENLGDRRHQAKP